MRDTAEIVRRLRVALEDTQRGYEDLTGPDPTRRHAGLRNVVVFGRSVTQVAQTMRDVDRERFNAWYASYEAEMAKDSLMRFFNTLRTIILKEGAPATTTSGFIEHFDMRDVPPPPPGASSFFVGDSLGGSGWIIEQPDGTQQKFYINLPAEAGSWTFHLENPPDTHLGKSIEDDSAQGLSALYIDYLSRFVEAFESEFSK
jgi:hypothetical protein